MRISEIGEFGLIAKLSKLIGSSLDESVLLPIGDDCAVVKANNVNLLISSDMSIEGVHFLEQKFPSTAIGWKAMMSAWSDIASMGGIPRWALVSWGLPSYTAVGKALSIYRGMVEATDFVGGKILGGDTVSCEKIIIDVMVVGECINGRYITRRGAKLGDVVAITGVLGKSLAGLIALQRDLPEPSFWREHWYPFPKIKEGRWFCEKGYANSMIDISDGLLSDAKHLAEASNVGINIERDKILVDDDLKRFCDKYGYDPTEIFLRSGEEYELLVTISESVWNGAKDEFKNDLGCDLIEIGRVTDEWVGVRINGKEPTFEGYEHFK